MMSDPTHYLQQLDEISGALEGTAEYASWFREGDEVEEEWLNTGDLYESFVAEWWRLWYKAKELAKPGSQFDDDLNALHNNRHADSRREREIIQ